MLIKFETLKERLHGVILNKGEQGYDVSGLEEKLDNLPESFDSIMSFVDDINSTRIRDDWEYVEPNSIEEIKSNSDPNRIKSKICDVDLNDSSKRVEAAFLSSQSILFPGVPEAHRRPQRSPRRSWRGRRGTAAGSAAGS